jgi:hypothetical protein
MKKLRHLPAHLPKLHAKKVPPGARLWEWLFFGTIALVTIELVVFSLYFLHVGKVLEAPPQYDVDQSLLQLQALHQKVQSVQHVVDTRVGVSSQTN